MKNKVVMTVSSLIAMILSPLVGKAEGSVPQAPAESRENANTVESGDVVQSEVVFEALVAQLENAPAYIDLEEIIMRHGR